MVDGAINGEFVLKNYWVCDLAGRGWLGTMGGGWISRIDRAVTSPSSLPLRVQNRTRET